MAKIRPVLWTNPSVTGLALRCAGDRYLICVLAKVIVADDVLLTLPPSDFEFLFFYGEYFQLDYTMQRICRAALD